MRASNPRLMNPFGPIVSFQALLLTRDNSALSRPFRRDCRPLPCLCFPPASGAGDVIFLNIPGCCASGQYLKILRTSDAAGRRLLVVVFCPPVCLLGYCARLSMSRSVKVHSSVLRERERWNVAIYSHLLAQSLFPQSSGAA